MTLKLRAASSRVLTSSTLISFTIMATACTKSASSVAAASTLASGSTTSSIVSLEEPALPSAALGAYSYAPSKAPLYGSSGLPQASDVNQGNLGDCSLLSTLIGMALQFPNILSQHIKLVGQDAQQHDIYSVQLYYPLNGDYTKMTATEVQVSNQVLVNPQGATFDDLGSPLWPTLYEKAFATLNDKYHMVGTGAAGDTGFAALQDGILMPIALQVVTGENAAQTSYVNNTPSGSTALTSSQVLNILNQENEGVIVMTLDFDASGGLAHLQQVATEHNLAFDGTSMTLPSGLLVSIEQDDNEGNFRIQGLESGKYITIIGGHAYVAEGSDSVQGGNVEEVVMDNPWNWSEESAGDEEGATTFKLDFPDFLILAQRMSYVTAPTN